MQCDPVPQSDNRALYEELSTAARDSRHRADETVRNMIRNCDWSPSYGRTTARTDIRAPGWTRSSCRRHFLVATISCSGCATGTVPANARAATSREDLSAIRFDDSKKRNVRRTSLSEE
jgi:hypothetical protein